MLTTLHQICEVHQEKERKFALQPCNIFKILNIDITLNKLLNKEKGRLKLQNSDDDDGDGDKCISDNQAHTQLGTAGLQARHPKPPKTEM
jgi:hypothetical protein